MSAAVKIKQGETVPIFLQLGDGNEALFPQARVYAPNETLIATINLDHVSQGVYYPDSAYSMPEQNFIVVSVSVFSDSSRTIEALYSRASSVFVRDLDATQASVNDIPTNPLLTNDARLNNLDASISSRATQASVNALNDLSSADVQSALTSQGYTTARAQNLDNLNASISSRATQASVESIPTNPVLADDSRLDRLDADVSSRSNHTAGDIWDVVLALHQAAGSTGRALSDAAAATGGGGGGGVIISPLGLNLEGSLEDIGEIQGSLEA